MDVDARTDDDKTAWQSVENNPNLMNSWFIGELPNERLLEEVQLARQLRRPGFFVCCATPMISLWLIDITGSRLASAVGLTMSALMIFDAVPIAMHAKKDLGQPVRSRQH